MPAWVNTWLVVVPVPVVPSPKFQWLEVMLPVDEPALKDTVSGAVPLSGAAEIGLVGSVVLTASMGGYVSRLDRLLSVPSRNTDGHAEGHGSVD